MTEIAATPKATGHVGATESVPNATTADTPAVQPATVTCFVLSESPLSPVFDGCVLSLTSYAPSLPNVPDQRPRASDGRNATAMLMRGSVQPVFGVVMDLLEGYLTTR